MIATVTALTANVPVPLLIRLVATGQWTVARAVEYARNLHYPSSRAYALAGLSEFLPRDQQQAAILEALAAAQSTVDDQRYWLLKELLPKLPAGYQDQVREQALATALALDEDAERASSLVDIALELPEPKRREALMAALNTAEAIQDEGTRVNVLVEIAWQAPEFLVDQLLAAAAGIDDGYNRARIVAALTERLPTSHIPVALACARSIQQPDCRLWVFRWLATRMGEAERQPLLSEAKADAYATADPSDRAWALAVLAEVLDDEHRQRVLADALTAARELDHGTLDRALRLVLVARGLTGDPRTAALDDALTSARAIENIQQRCLAMHKVASIMDFTEREPVLSEILAMARHMDDDSIIEVVGELAPILPGSLFPEALSITGALSIHHQRHWLLGHLADHLPPALVGEALSTAQTLSHDFGRTQLLGEMLPCQRHHLTIDALKSARAITSAYYRTLALIELADHLSDRRAPLLDEALNAAGLTTNVDRTQLVATLAPLLSSPVAEDAAIKALPTALNVRDPYNRTRALANLIPHLPESQRAEARHGVVAAARDVTPAYQSGLLLVHLAAVFPEGRRRDAILRDGLDVLQQLPVTAGSLARLTRKLARIAGYLPRKLLLDIAEILYAATNLDERAETPVISARTIRYLRLVPNRLIAETITALHTLPSNFYVTHVLGPLALHLSPPLRQKALAEALSASRETRLARRRVIQDADRLRAWKPATEDIALLRRCLDTLELNDCLSVLAAAVPMIRAAAGGETLDSVLRSVRMVERWWYPTSGDEPGARTQRG